jgi:hypothetical protein
MTALEVAVLRDLPYIVRHLQSAEIIRTRRELAILKTDTEELKELVHRSNQQVLDELTSLKSMMMEFMGNNRNDRNREKKKRKHEDVSK